MAEAMKDEEEVQEAPTSSEPKSAETLEKEQILGGLFSYGMTDYIGGLKKDGLELDGYGYVAKGEEGVDIVNLESTRGKNKLSKGQ